MCEAADKWAAFHISYCGAEDLVTSVSEAEVIAILPK